MPVEVRVTVNPSIEVARRMMRRLYDEVRANRRSGGLLRRTYAPLRPILEDAIRKETPVDSGELLSQITSAVRSARGRVFVAAGYTVPSSQRAKVLALEYGNARTRAQAPLQLAGALAFPEARTVFFQTLQDQLDFHIPRWRRQEERRLARLAARGG